MVFQLRYLNFLVQILAPYGFSTEIFKFSSLDFFFSEKLWDKLDMTFLLIVENISFYNIIYIIHI